MIVLLGATGYIGGQFARALRERGIRFVAPLRSETDYGRFTVLREFLEKARPEFLINAAGYTGKPNVDACEKNWADTLQGNTLFPAAVAQACDSLGISFGHVSSGCIYSGAKVDLNGGTRVEKDLAMPELRALVEKSPESIHGFTENDTPNFSFRDGPCSFYSGSKALGEEAMLGTGQGYLWRLRIPFDEFDSARNYLSKVQRYAKVYDNVNSISHRADFVNACLDLWKLRAPPGIYNVTNPGFVTTRDVVRQIEKFLRPPRSFEFWANDEEFYRVAAKTPRSNCVMDCGKLLAAGVKMRPVQEALITSLKNWQPEK
jgi:dTDP-4-dehydrorhamnose reductase